MHPVADTPAGAPWVLGWLNPATGWMTDGVVDYAVASGNRSTSCLDGWVGAAGVPGLVEASPSRIDDDALMSAIAQRQPQALAALYDRYAPYVLALCQHILKNRALAEEVLGDVFWEVWDRSQRYRADRSSTRSYLMMLARSRSIDRLRSERPHRERTVSTSMDDADTVATGQPRQPSPLEHVVAVELRQHLTQAMQTLEPDHRHTLHLSFFEGLSHSKIAEQLQQPLGTVKTRIRQGLIRLRDSLRTYYGSEDGS